MRQQILLTDDVVITIEKRPSWLADEKFGLYAIAFTCAVFALIPLASLVH